MSPQGLWGDGRKGEKQREGGERGKEEVGRREKREKGCGSGKWEERNEE